MAKNLLVINVDIRETRVALIENGIIAELHIERESSKGTLGNIYLGKVSRVLPGMQAAFIDVGLERAAFLHVEDLIRPDDFEAYLAGHRKGGAATDEDRASGPSVEESPEALAATREMGIQLPTALEAQEAVAAEAELEEDDGPDEQLISAGAASDEPEERRAEHGLSADEVPDELVEDVVPEEPAFDDEPAEFPLEDAEEAEAEPAAAEAAPVEPVEVMNVEAAIVEPANVEAEAPAAAIVEGSPVELAAASPLGDNIVPLDLATPRVASKRGARVRRSGRTRDCRPLGDAEAAPVEASPAAAPAPSPERGRRESGGRQSGTGGADSRRSGGRDGRDGRRPEGGGRQGGAGAEGAARQGSAAGTEGGARQGGDNRRQGSSDNRRQGGSDNRRQGGSDNRRAGSGSGGDGRRMEGGGRGRSSSSGGSRGRQNELSRISKATPIREVVREGQEVIVQISKEPIGTKGARVTSHISLPGRYVVYLPTVDHVGISKRIGSDRERSRLREAMEAMKPPQGGLIVRTVAEGLTKKQLKADVGYLVRLWGEVAKKREGSTRAPTCIYTELDLVLKTARDLFTDDIEKIVIDSRVEHERLKRFVEMFLPERAAAVELYEGEEPIFDAYGIEDEIARAQSRKVPLTSGGHLIIDQAEALTAIDVNTGRFVGKGSKDLEETILRTNLEAVEEIAYQLRFRNIGGLIILDLIDMERAGNREKVRRRLEDLLAKDKAKTTLNRISDLGLIEMTRKRTRESLGRTVLEPCFYCDGTGQLQSKQTVAYEILRQIRRERSNLPGYSVVVSAHPAVIDLLKGDERVAVTEAERLFERRIELVPRKEYHLEQFDLQGK